MIPLNFSLFPLLLILFLYICSSVVYCRISNERKCASNDCSVPISLATTLLQYHADDERLLSFPRNVQAKVFSKEAGDTPTLWEAEIRGKRGYVPKGLLKEYKILVDPKKVNIIVPTGREDAGKRNVTLENTEKSHSVTTNVHETPALPVANSKGLFSMMGGVSADSVPPNSPDINPHTTEKYQVFDGTTIYNDPANEIAGKPPEVTSDVKESHVITDVPLVENVVASETKEPLPSESVPSDVKTEKDTSEGGIEASAENKVPETSTELPEKLEENVEPETHVKESEGFISGIVNTVSNLISSGTGEEEEEDETESNEEEEGGSGDEETGNENDSTEKKQIPLQREIVNNEVEKNDNDGVLTKETNAQVLSVEENKSEASSVFHTTKSYSNSRSNDTINLGSAEISSKVYEEDQGVSAEEDNVFLSSGETKEVDNTAENNLNNTAVESTSSSSSVSNVMIANKKEAETTKESLSSEPAAAETILSNPLELSNVEVDTKRDEPVKETTKSKPIDILKATQTKPTTPLKGSEEKVLSDVKEGETLNNVKPDVSTAPSELDKTSESGSFENQASFETVAEKPVVKPVHEEPESQVMPHEDQPTLFGYRTGHIKKNTADQQKHASLESTTMKNQVETISPEENSSEQHKQENVEPTQGKTQVETTSQQKEDHSEIKLGLEQVVRVPSTPPPYIPLFQQSKELPKYSSVVDDSLVIQSHEKTEDIPREKANEPIPPTSVYKVLEPQIIPEKDKEETTLVTNEVLPSQAETVEAGPSEADIVDLSATEAEIVEVSSINAEEVNSIEAEQAEVGPTEAEEVVVSPPETDGDYVIPPEANEVETEAGVLESIPTENGPEETLNEDSEGMFSWISPIFDLFSSSDSASEAGEIPTISEVPTHSENKDPFLMSQIKDESCLVNGLGEGACEALNKEPPQDVFLLDSLYSADMSAALELLDKIPLETTIWLVITAVVVLIFSLGHYYIEAHRRDGPLVAVINKLEREVLILKKESSIIEDRFQTYQEQLEAWNTNSSENDALIVELKEELEEAKAAKLELEEQVAELEREVQTVTESGMEMHHLLESSLSSQDGSQALLSTVESLREKLGHQESEIAFLSTSLQLKNVEVQELNEKLAQAAEVASGLENRIIAVIREKEEEALDLKDKHRQLIEQLEEVVETKTLDETRVSTEMSKLRLTIEELQKSLVDKDSELEEVKDVVKQLRSTDSNEKMDALFDVVAVRAQLKLAVTERDDFREKYQEEEGARKLLEGHMKKITQEVAELKNSFETAEKEKIEALTKLQVLSNYFKEKESQLQKELGSQESMWLQKQSDDHTIYEQMKSLREENEKYKLQNESLKKEIVEQESSFKIQLANVEQKAHENWVASRQAERKLKEVQQEASQLRNRLTMEKNAANYNSLDDGKQNISESNGDPSSPPPSLIFPPTTSPPFMMYPPIPPGDFMPPPPLTGSPYSSDSRPPPLGRISSPPLDHRFSPPPPLQYSPYDYPPYGHHSPSPPPPLPSHSHHRNVHKPQPREMSREQKDHSSNYSPESEKPKRRNKR